MKKRFWLYKRGEVFYLQDAETRQKESLHTKDSKEAERLRDARNQSVDRPHLGLALAKAYLAAYDPTMVERFWTTVMAELAARGKRIGLFRQCVPASPNPDLRWAHPITANVVVEPWRGQS